MRGDAADYLNRFVEEMKASGFIPASLARAHQSALIAPPGK
jgi:hypothetical protein